MAKKLKTNAIYRGDCKNVLKKFPKESIDLIYLDPPFFSNKKHEVIWGNGYEIRSFEDRWKGGIMNFIDWLKDRVELCYSILKETGSLYLHCDYRASHYIKVHVLDEIFGYKNLQNEIIWHYKSGGRAKNSFPRKHDTLFWYSKSKKFTFNPEEIGTPRPLCPYCKEERENWNHLKKHIDEDGRIYRTIKSGKKRYKYYDDELVPPTDVWVDISHLQQKDPERLGYPTQKPESLLERIIKASSNKGDIVLDPVCGCGTTIAAAYKLKRQYIGIDVSPTACKLMANRIRKLGVPIELYYMPTSIKELKKLNHFDFQNWVVEQYSGRSERKTGDYGIDGYSFEGIPIQVKQSSRAGRNVVDNFETAIRRKRKKEGIIVAFSFTKGAYEEVARAKVEGGLEIKLVTVKKLLDEFN